MLNLIKIIRARREAMAVLKPFLRQVHVVTPPLFERSWLHPHVLGFLSTVVTVIAEETNGPFRSHTLAAIQSGVLVAITNASAEVLGEEITLFSSRQDPAFIDGCSAAHLFVAALQGERSSQSTDAAYYETFVPEKATSSDLADIYGCLPKNASDIWNEHVLMYLSGQVRTT